MDAFIADKNPINASSNHWYGLIYVIIKKSLLKKFFFFVNTYGLGPGCF